MILLIDSGNSRLKWAWQTTANAPLHAPNAAHFDDALTQIAHTGKTPSHILVGNVAGTARANAISAWASKNWALNPRFIHTQTQAGGVTNAYSQPQNLGVDRWLALIGARQRQNTTDLLIADCGTAITLDKLNANGNHQGGLIVPGLQLMQDTLINRAPGIHATAPDGTLWAQDTPQAVGNGALHTVIHLLDGMASNHQGKLLLTGGDAATLLPYLHTNWEFVPHLVLEGLRTFSTLN